MKKGLDKSQALLYNKIIEKNKATRKGKERRKQMFVVEMIIEVAIFTALAKGFITFWQITEEDF